MWLQDATDLNAITGYPIFTYGYNGTCGYVYRKNVNGDSYQEEIQNQRRACSNKRLSVLTSWHKHSLMAVPQQDNAP